MAIGIQAPAAPHIINAEVPTAEMLTYETLLERFSNTYVLTDSIEGGFFLRKKPLSCVVSVYSIWRTAIATPASKDRSPRTPAGTREWRGKFRHHLRHTNHLKRIHAILARQVVTFVYSCDRRTRAERNVFAFSRARPDTGASQ